MPSEYSLRGTGWSASDFGGIPAKSDVEVECDECDTTTTADDMDGWDVTTSLETYETTRLCPECAVVECDECDTTTTADDVDEWDVTTCWESCEMTRLCPECVGDSDA